MIYEGSPLTIDSTARIRLMPRSDRRGIRIL